ncbi:MAG TPA: sigma-70 family RNA polymerase sigma factor [Verrucomicrobiae bacterium]|nr:sigma-70 family RNA polymerase sigma factor [Verrucomicrobiae bacterium]
MAAPVGPADETTVDSRSDQTLIDAINDGDTEAFEVLYYRYRDWVANLAVRFTGDRDLALDVLQETFVYFVKKFPGFRLTARLKTFLYPAVRNLSIAARRRTRRLQSSPEELAILAGLSTTAPLPIGNECLEAALRSLSQEHGEVLLLRFVDGLSLAEIAGTLDIPLGTVKSRLHNALGALRRDSRTKSFFEP